MIHALLESAPAFACCVPLPVACCAALAADAAPPVPAPAIAMHGDPALKGPFDHLPYADPAASKGGRLAIGFLGTFDSLNPFNLKAGSTAQGLNGNVFETLMTRSLDEPFTLYGLIAQTIETHRRSQLRDLPARSARAFFGRRADHIGRRPFHLRTLEDQGAAATARRLFPRQIDRNAGRADDPLRSDRHRTTGKCR